MDVERWAVVRAVFGELVELEPARRARRLEALGAADPELRDAVESLLAADVESSGRLGGAALPPRAARRESPVHDVFALAGQNLSHFRVLEPLGAGGMGVVYLAEDTRLGRSVALKLLLPHYTLDPSARQRFLGEARSAAALDHPNLCTIHEVGESPDGRLFLAMSFYRGETLKARLAREGALPVDEAVEISRQAAEGLACAHAAGIVHRDLKPGNLMLLPDGTVKILDFGLAKSEDLGLTATGERLGTLAYMAPEQLRGEAADARADLWALGIVLHEMLTGKRPLAGGLDLALADSTARAVSYRPVTRGARIPAALEDTVTRLLAQDRADRPASAMELAKALAAIQAVGTPSSPSRRPRRLGPHRSVRTRALAYLAGAVVLGALMLVVAEDLVSLVGGQNANAAVRTSAGDRPGPATASPAAGIGYERSIAVLPFANLSREPDDEYLSDGITEEILNALARVPGLRVAGRYASFAYKGKDTPLAEIARELQVHSVLEGSVRLDGNRVRIYAHLMDAATGDQLWAESYDGSPSEILTIQERIAREIAGALRVRLGANGVVVRGLADPRAYDLYLRGLYERRKPLGTDEGREALRRAIDYMRQAVLIDSSSAYAYTGLSRVYEVAHLFLPEVSPEAALREADVAARRAVVLDSMLADARSALAWTLAYRHRDYAAAEREHRLAIELNPRDVWVRWAYSAFLRTTGRPEEGAREARLAIALDPRVPGAWNALGSNLAAARRYSDAEAAYTTARVRAGLPPNYTLLIQHVLVPQRRIAEARGALDRLGGARRLPRHAAYVEATAGRVEAARRLLAEESHDPQDRMLAPVFVHVALGETDSAFASLESWTGPGGFPSYDSPFDPRLTPLHADPRWGAFLREVKLR